MLVKLHFTLLFYYISGTNINQPSRISASPISICFSFTNFVKWWRHIEYRRGNNRSHVFTYDRAGIMWRIGIMDREEVVIGDEEI